MAWLCLGWYLNISFSLTTVSSHHTQVNMLRRRDAEQGRIAFVDISSPDYSAEQNADISYEQVDTRGCEAYMLVSCCIVCLVPFADHMMVLLCRRWGRFMLSIRTVQ